MATESPQSSERSIAQQSQEKFEFYLLSLVFTLLALAVQTAVFGTNHVKNALELSCWVLFLVSGLSGLYRLQWVPVTRSVMADKRSFEEEVFKLKELQLQGQTELLVLETQSRQPISERIENRQYAVSKLGARVLQLESRVQFSYDVHKWAFVLGLLAVISARAYEPTVALVAYVFP